MQLASLFALSFLLMTANLPASPAHAQAVTSLGTAPLSIEAARATNEGSLPWEIAGAMLGDALGIGLSALVFLPAIGCVSCDEGDEGTDEGANQRLAFGVGWGARPLLVGGFTALLARPSGGQGRAYAAMLGSIPGLAVIAMGWILPDRPNSTAIFAGHVLSVGGAVAGYRLSARRRSGLSEPRVTPSAFADKQGFGVSVSGRF